MTSRWAPLESNPEVLTQWAGLTGLATKSAAFHDIYSLDEELLAVVPQPVKAVILVFPLTDEIEAALKKEDEKLQNEEQPHLDPTIYFIKQTISNACGTIALLHAIYNTDVTIKPGSALEKFRDQSVDKDPFEKAKLLETTPLFATAHATAASGGQSSMPAGLRTNEHFVAFVKAPDNGAEGEDGTSKHRLVSLDGRRGGAVDCGACTDLLRDAGKYIQERYMSLAKGDDNDNFGMIALGPAKEE